MTVIYQKEFTPGWKMKIWPMWCSGTSLSNIGRAVGKHPTTVSEVIRSNGDYSPRIQKRSENRLCIEERE